MRDYDIEIKMRNDFISAANAAIKICVALEIQSLLVETKHGFSVCASKDSNLADLDKIYRLQVENIKLSKK